MSPPTPTEGTSGDATADSGDAERDTSTSADAAARGDDTSTSDDDDGQVERLRVETARYRKEAREWRQKAEAAERDRDAATKTAEERLERLEAAERRSARATIERLATTAGFHAGEPAHEIDALAQLLAADDGGEQQVADRLKAIAKERPYLVAARDGRVLTPGRQQDVSEHVADKDAWLRG